MDPKIILALDMPSLSEGQQWLEENPLPFHMIKVGLQLFCSTERSELVEFAKKYPVFLDLKLHDIPNTVSSAILALEDIQPQFLTIHCSGGPAMIEESLKAQEIALPDTKLLGVSVLTSLSDRDLAQMGISHGADHWAAELVNMSYQAGLRHFVCSVHEAPSLKGHFPSEINVITPGIRFEAQSQDQKRVATPSLAAENQVDYMVIGRALTASEDPLNTYDQIIQDWHAGQNKQAA